MSTDYSDAISSTEEIIEDALERFKSHAAYGAVAIKAMEGLERLAGISPETDDDTDEHGLSFAARRDAMLKRGRLLSPLGGSAIENDEDRQGSSPSDPT